MEFASQTTKTEHALIETLFERLECIAIEQIPIRRLRRVRLDVVSECIIFFFSAYGHVERVDVVTNVTVCCLAYLVLDEPCSEGYETEPERCVELVDSQD